jgi:hypothetical protein
MKFVVAILFWLIANSLKAQGANGDHAPDPDPRSHSIGDHHSGDGDRSRTNNEDPGAEPSQATAPSDPNPAAGPPQGTLPGDPNPGPGTAVPHTMLKCQRALASRVAPLTTFDALNAIPADFAASGCQLSGSSRELCTPMALTNVSPPLAGPTFSAPELTRAYSCYEMTCPPKTPHRHEVVDFLGAGQEDFFAHGVTSICLPALLERALLPVVRELRPREALRNSPDVVEARHIERQRGLRDG